MNQLFNVFCSSCNIQVEARTICEGNSGFNNDAINPIDESDATYNMDMYYVLLCPRCDAPFLLQQKCCGVPGEFETVTSETVLYPTITRLPTDGIPEPVNRAYQQAVRCFSASSYEASALMCRRCLEALCKSFVATGKSLQAMLDDLCAAKVIERRLTQWAHRVRVIANGAAHDTDIELSKDDAQDALDFTESLLMYVFVLNVRFGAFVARRGSQFSRPE